MPIDLELLQKIERQRQRLEDGVLPAKMIDAPPSPARKESVSFAATTPPSQELSRSFVTPSSRSSGSTPELGSYRLTEGHCEALEPWTFDLETDEDQLEGQQDGDLYDLMQSLWQVEPSEASLAATAHLCLGPAPERCPSRDLSPVDETKVMAWRPRHRRGSPRGVPRAAAKRETRPMWSGSKAVSNAKKPQGSTVTQPLPSACSRGQTARGSTELQLRRLSKELAAEGQRFRQQGKLCFELAVRAETLHSEVRVQQQQAAREREAKLVRAAGRLKVSSMEKDNS